MNVLSLFDGLGGARIVLDRLAIPCKYYASEIDKYAIKIALKNYPDTIQVGDIKNIKVKNLSKIDLLIGSSPCQDLSIAKKAGRRLQGLPDNYTKGISDTQRYKMIGNGFTVSVIKHILKYMEK